MQNKGSVHECYKRTLTESEIFTFGCDAVFSFFFVFVFFFSGYKSVSTAQELMRSNNPFKFTSILMPPL